MNMMDPTAEQDQHPPTEEGGDESMVSPSILDRLKQKRQKVTEQRYLDLPVPGYEGDLVARYKTVPFKVFEEAEKRQKKDKSAPKMLLAAIDQIINTCEMILVKDPGHADCVTDNDGVITEYRPIDPQAAATSFPVRWDTRLAPLINIPETEHQNNPRLVVTRTFCNDAAVIHHATQIGLWLRDTTKEVDEAFLGE